MLLPSPFQKKPDVRELEHHRDIGGLIGALSSPHTDIQAAAVRALGTIGTPAVTPLVDALQTRNRTLRLGIIGALAEIHDSRALAALAGQTKDSSSEIRWQAAIALGEMGDAAGIPVLLESLRDKDKYVRYASAISLLKAGYRPVTETEWSWYYAGMQQWDDLTSLGKVSLEALFHLMSDPDSRVRCRAARVMGAIGDRDAGPVLLLALGDPDRQVRWEAVQASQKCGVPPMQLPRALCKRPRNPKNPLVAGLLNFLLPGLGYGYLGKWWGIMIFQIDITVTIWLFKATGEANSYSVLFPFYLLLAVHAWYITKMMPEEAP